MNFLANPRDKCFIVSRSTSHRWSTPSHLQDVRELLSLPSLVFSAFATSFSILLYFLFSPLDYKPPYVCMLSHVWLLLTSWTIAHQAPLSMEFSRQEYWSRLPFPSPGHLPNPEIKPTSPALAGEFLTTAPPGKPLNLLSGSLVPAVSGTIMGMERWDEQVMAWAWRS